MKVLILNGPNLNLLGIRETDIYGSKKYDEIITECQRQAKELQIDLSIKQSNHEGELIDAIQAADGEYEAIILNPGAFTHYSYAIRDAVSSVKVPVVELHLSNIKARERFRKKSVISPVASGIIAGFGWKGYILALRAVLDLGERE